MYFLFLDDERQPSAVGLYFEPKELRRLYYEKDWFIVQNYEEFVQTILELGLPELISFDHDLAEIKYSNGVSYFKYRDKTGLDCAKWLINYCTENKKQLPEFLVHSKNTDGGAKDITDALTNFKEQQK